MMTEYKQLLDRAAALCSTGEKCQHDIRSKMLSWGLEEKEVDKALKFLVENMFIDHLRYTTFFVRDKLKINKWGRIKIMFALRQKRIEEEIIESCIADIDPDLYQSVLDELLQNKIRSSGSPDTPQNKAKLIRFAAQRGFTSNEIYDAFDRMKD